jgi:hypothetical protein
MSSVINNSDKNVTNGSMSICIPRAFENISEARVRNVFDKLGIFTIDRVDVVLRKNEKGESYKRFFVHIKDWAHTDDAQKAKERLIAGKELKIVYDDPWFWKVGLNTWAPKLQQPLLNDRKPRIRLEFEEEEADKNVKAATTLLTNLSLQQSLEERDRRPYSQRRLDPAYCEQDVKQGFRDRRKPLKKEEKSVEVVKPVITQPKPQKKVEEVKKPVFVMNPEIRLMVATYHGIGRDEVTEELYKNTSQFVRDLRQDDMDRQKDEDAEHGIKPLNYSAAPAIPPKRNRGKIVE